MTLAELAQTFSQPGRSKSWALMVARRAKAQEKRRPAFFPNTPPHLFKKPTPG